jgi:carbon monoxide dehydrogenase subunit G
MQLENEFTVPAPPEDVWKTLLDVERVAPCMPGATVDRVDGDEVTGHMKVKVGPITASYAGTARFVTKDEGAHRFVLEGSGRETRGSGTASATVEVTMSEEGTSTRVSVVTDLQITGKPAQFGRGVLGDVAGKLTDQFAACLAQQVTGPPAAAPRAGEGTLSEAPSGGAPSATSATATATAAAAERAAAPQAAGQPAEALDMFGTVALPVLRRSTPVAVSVILGLILGLMLGHRRRIEIIVPPMSRRPKRPV